MITNMRTEIRLRLTLSIAATGGCCCCHLVLKVLALSVPLSLSSWPPPAAVGPVCVPRCKLQLLKLVTAMPASSVKSFLRPTAAAALMDEETPLVPPILT
uniref:Uncharacterized protein n=1 Tax=Vitrella brassicaformis TaxID=1169539 RepID=A0A7S1JKV2_9ALVE